MRSNLTLCLFQCKVTPELSSLTFSQLLPVNETVTPTQAPHIVIACFCESVRVLVVLLVKFFAVNSFLAIIRGKERFFVNGTMFEIIYHNGVAVNPRVLITTNHECSQFILDGVAENLLLRSNDGV